MKVKPYLNRFSSKGIMSARPIPTVHQKHKTLLTFSIAPLKRNWDYLVKKMWSGFRLKMPVTPHWRRLPGSPRAKQKTVPIRTVTPFYVRTVFLPESSAKPATTVCFTWKAASAGREVLLLAGDIHVGVDSLITDATTGLTIRHITTSSITNAISKFFNPLEGALSERYSYTHKVLDGLHNYADLDLKLMPDGATVEAKVELVGVPIPAKE